MHMHFFKWVVTPLLSNVMFFQLMECIKLQFSPESKVLKMARMYSRVLICPFTFLPDYTKIHAFCVFRQENEWTLLNRTIVETLLLRN